MEGDICRVIKKFSVRNKKQKKNYKKFNMLDDCTKLLHHVTNEISQMPFSLHFISILQISSVQSRKINESLKQKRDIFSSSLPSSAVDVFAKRFNRRKSYQRRVSIDTHACGEGKKEGGKNRRRERRRRNDTTELYRWTGRGVEEGEEARRGFKNT